MNRTRHGDHLFKLTQQAWCNCYLVRDDGGLTLIDAGVGNTTGSILEAADEIGEPIRRLTLTHAHPDHVGSFDKLAAALPEAEVCFGAREARFLRGDKSMDPGEPQAKPRTMSRVKTEPARELTPGERLGSLEVVSAPGHTPGQIAFLDTRDRTLICGDAFVTIGGLSVTSNVNWRFPFPALGTWHRPTALETGKALRALEPSRLAVGHGAVAEDPVAAMDRVLEAAER